MFTLPRRIFPLLAVLCALVAVPVSGAMAGPSAGGACTPASGGQNCIGQTCANSNTITFDTNGTIIYCPVITPPSTTSTWINAACDPSKSGVACIGRVCSSFGQSVYIPGQEYVACESATGGGDCTRDSNNNYCTWVVTHIVCTPSGSGSSCAGNTCSTLGLTEMDSNRQNLVTCLWTGGSSKNDCSDGGCQWKSMTSSLLGYQIVSNTSPSTGWHYVETVQCPAGKKVIGGGCYQYTGTETAAVSWPPNGFFQPGSGACDVGMPCQRAIVDSAPFDDGSGWRCYTRDITTEQAAYTTAYAICATVQ